MVTSYLKMYKENKKSGGSGNDCLRPIHGPCSASAPKATDNRSCSCLHTVHPAHNKISNPANISITGGDNSGGGKHPFGGDAGGVKIKYQG